MSEHFMYLTASRPDIVHATCYCARYQAKPTEKHLTAVKRIFRYLKDSFNMGLLVVIRLSQLVISKKRGLHFNSSTEAEYGPLLRARSTIATRAIQSSIPYQAHAMSNITS
ncbi:hypothetical protein Tco_0191602 [Tanacetum coccineum]